MVKLALALALALVAGCRTGSDDANNVPIDAPGCESCGPDQICVQVLGDFRGECPSYIQCKDRNPACTGTTCSPDCDFWECRDGQDAGSFGCTATWPCENLIPNALHCWGP
jgi:hypothetical protein